MNEDIEKIINERIEESIKENLTVEVSYDYGMYTNHIRVALLYNGKVISSDSIGL